MSGKIRSFPGPPKKYSFHQNDLWLDTKNGDIYFKDRKHNLKKTWLDTKHSLKTWLTRKHSSIKLLLGQQEKLLLGLKSSCKFIN